MTVAMDKESETGNIALLIAAYLTLNTSLNLLNKVKFESSMAWQLVS